MNKRQYVTTLALSLYHSGQVMSGRDLASNLNSNGFQTNYGTPYVGARGIYTLIRSIYHWLVSLGNQNDADVIAEVFVKPDGTYAYD
jgi:hypothetical protein